MLYIGCHLSSSKGFAAMGRQALELGANTFQFFTRNPRGSRAKDLDPADAAALVELMALDFAIDELGLYLTTHAQDQEALQLYWSYLKLAKEGREKYTAKYGPLDSAELVLEDGYTWLNDPWPWELGGNA